MTDKEILKAFNQSRKKGMKKAGIRPKFMLHKELLQLLTAFAVICVTLCFRSVMPDSFLAVILSAELILLFVTQTKNLLLLLIFLYQKAAPMAIRGACLFTPSCSEYMRLSILKYGVLRGVKKGFHRLRRCRPPNGGIDEP